MSESVKKEQIIYTWKYDAEIGWQLWKSEGEEEEKICAPGVYILKDGIYYLGVYETEDKEVSRIKEEEPEQGVLKRRNGFCHRYYTSDNGRGKRNYFAGRYILLFL